MTFIRLLSVGAICVVCIGLSAATSSGQESKLERAFTRCLSEALIAGNYIEPIPPLKTEPWVTLMCDGRSAEALFSAMELVSDQKLNSNRPGLVDQVTRTAGRISCLFVAKSSTTCLVRIEANPDFVNGMRS